ncbi:hypothetical protein EP073_10045 [Geovibrio thiophilus]|uniref:Uncharacterized protein n=1 Tax=Geovibrio thiophilus TaxID=139438 RepID=A0A3R5Y7R4_9BACT|nr:hypothetical protein [Geovibrio thiophilus]QAR33731.1 hypothetical protein EP073_10045 [Geovibrio thiophilus]
MDIRLNQTVKGLNQDKHSSAPQKETKAEGLDFEEILLEKTGSGFKESQAALIAGAARIFDEMAETWFSYEELLSGMDEGLFEDEYGFGSDNDNDELYRLEDLVKGRGYYSVDSVAKRLVDMVKDASGGRDTLQLADSLAEALRQTERNSGELPEALYEALDAASFRIRRG